jgi:hypothetical protein
VVFVRMKPPPHALPAERRVADEGC